MESEPQPTLNLDNTSAMQLKGIPVELLLEYYNQLAKQLELPPRDVLDPPSQMVKRITTLRGVRYAKGLGREGSHRLVVCLSSGPSESMTVGKVNPQGVPPNFNRYPGETVTRPDRGVILEALEQLEAGCTADDIEFLVISKGAPSRLHTRYRALELIRVLNHKHGWGFYLDNFDGKIYATDKATDVDLAIDELDVL
jgi:hypothetical protein